jgi:hypothetical protein
MPNKENGDTFWMCGFEYPIRRIHEVTGFTNGVPAGEILNRARNKLSPPQIDVLRHILFNGMCGTRWSGREELVDIYERLTDIKVVRNYSLVTWD